MSTVELAGNGQPLMPAGPVLRLVDEWLEQRDATFDPGMSQRRIGTPEPLSPMQQLEHRSGMASVARALYRMRHESSGRVSLGLADKLVSATVGPEAWRTDPDLDAVQQELGFNKDGAWREQDERESAEQWAARVWAGWSEKERGLFRSILPQLPVEGER